MKKIVVFVACILALVAVRVGDGGLTAFCSDFSGEYCEYTSVSNSTNFEKCPLLPSMNIVASRVDLGYTLDVGCALDYFGGKIVSTEVIDNLTVYYIFSPKLLKKLENNSIAFNLMLAISTESGRSVVGYPIIYGSY